MPGYRPSPSGEARVPPERQVQLRRPLSPPEAVLWSHLRDRRLAGFKFRRQHPLGVYIADFYCAEVRLVVEIDGASHAARVEHDRHRDAWMREQGLHVLRVSASAVAKDCDGVLKTIRAAAERSLGSGVARRRWGGQSGSRERGQTEGLQAEGM